LDQTFDASDLPDKYGIQLTPLSNWIKDKIVETAELKID